jgi:hypothetical protein
LRDFERENSVKLKELVGRQVEQLQPDVFVQIDSDNKMNGLGRLVVSGKIIEGMISENLDEAGRF